MIGPSQRPLPDNTQHSQETDIHSLAEIRTRNPNVRAAADPRLRPLEQRDRQVYIVTKFKSALNIPSVDKLPPQLM